MTSILRGRSAQALRQSGTLLLRQRLFRCELERSFLRRPVAVTYLATTPRHDQHRDRVGTTNTGGPDIAGGTGGLFTRLSGLVDSSNNASGVDGGSGVGIDTSSSPKNTKSASTYSTSVNQDDAGGGLGPREPDPPSAQPLQLRRLFSLIGEERGLMAVALGAQLVSSGATMVFPLALGQIVDTVQVQSNATDISQLIMGMAGVFTVASVATATRVATLSLVGGRISRRLRKTLFESVLRQDTRFFDRTQSGEIVNRLSSDVSIVSRTLTDNTAKMIRNGVTGTVSLGMVLYLSPKLTAVALCFVPPMLGFGVMFGRTARRLSRELVDALARATQVASERLGAIRTVRLFGAEEYEVKRYSDVVDSTYMLGRRVAGADGIFTGGMFYAAQMSLLGVLYVGGSMVQDPASALTVGTLTSFSMYAVQLGIASSSIGTAYGQLLRALGSGQRVFEVMDRKPGSPTSTIADGIPGASTTAPAATQAVGMADDTRVHEGLVDSDKIQSVAGTLPEGYDATVEFRDVHFEYVDDEPLLRGVNLTVRPGEICAIAGVSGSGKSTVAALLSRLYLPKSGTVRLSDVDASELDLAWLRKQVAVVPQETVLFDGTVADNILYGQTAATLSADGEPFGHDVMESGTSMPRSAADQEAVEQAAKAAASHDMIMRLRDGYDTRVGERGQGLSGGQRARIAIARALLRKPRVLVLDEATAALDNESEVAVARAIRAAAAERGATVLVIAHRLSSLRRAHRIAVLVDGRVAETGTFDDLKSRPDSHFARMVSAGRGSGRPRPAEPSQQ